MFKKLKTEFRYRIQAWVEQEVKLSKNSDHAYYKKTLLDSITLVQSIIFLVIKHQNLCPEMTVPTKVLKISRVSFKEKEKHAPLTVAAEPLNHLQDTNK